MNLGRVGLQKYPKHRYFLFGLIMNVSFPETSANSIDEDKTPHNRAFDQGSLCLLAHCSMKN